MTRQQIIRATGIGGFHTALVAAMITGSTAADWIVFTCVYPLAAIGVGVSMHRYFAHQSFKTSRVFQFVLALMAALAFGNAVHFAGKHRLHHRYSDKPGDVHSPSQGLWQCWIGSMINCGYSDEAINQEVQKYLIYPELRWLHRNSMLPGIFLCMVLFTVGGFSMMVIGGIFSSVLLLHQSSAVNYFCHRSGSRRFQTGDESTNNILVALLTYGEGWHNNHHYLPRSARAGLTWRELDLFYYCICLFERLGLVWDVQRARNWEISVA